MANTPTSMWIAHDSTCYDVRGMQTEPRHKATRREPDARPHRCLNVGVGDVVLVQTDVEPHAYAPSMIWPGDTPRALCRICRSWQEHADEKPWELATLNRRLALMAKGEW